MFGKKGTCVVEFDVVEDVSVQSMRKVLSREQSLVVPNGKGMVTEPHCVRHFGRDSG